MKASIPIGIPIKSKISSISMSRIGYRWHASINIEVNGESLSLLATGSIAQWLNEGDHVQVKLVNEPKEVDGIKIAVYEDYELERLWVKDWVKIWPLWSKEYRLHRRSLLSGDSVYEYTVIAREAFTEQDYMDVVSLEQYHYASEEVIVAVWRCPICGHYMESNIQPKCPQHNIPARLQEIRGSLPSSRFLVLELKDRRPYEPRIVAYVRVDTPIPLMSRRIVDEKGARIERMIREKVFPEDWFHPTFWPSAYAERKELLTRYRELAKLYKSGRLARVIVGEEISREALRNACTAAARIARVVVHPDYRGDGLGVLAVKTALEWIKDRRIPEMKREKHVVETIAQMARYNPFFEKAGFKYMWETASGRPVLMYPLTDDAKKRIEEFLSRDPYAKIHGGKLYRPMIKGVEPLRSPIVFKGLTKVYSSTLDISKLPQDLQDLLRAFGVERRLVERYVIRDANIVIEPGDIVVLVGASGAGKTTMLRMIIGAVEKAEDERYKPTSGDVEVPENVKLQCLIPGEREPVITDEPLIETLSRVSGDPLVAVEVLNAVGLSDAVFYRARFQELSTGQKERAKLAFMLAERPNLMVIDEFAAHLDPLTSQRVAYKLSRLCRELGITLVVASNRAEIIKALAPTKIIFIGYGTAFQVSFEEFDMVQL
ncbi:MAG: ABC transporter ATP-binding protein [Thermoprotei archaeon]|nr:MAG: ABC transporter ATP-binding protein [Thermoprotei archaeon]